MKNNFLILAVAPLILHVSCGADEAASNDVDSVETESSETGTFTIDTEQSMVKWQGGMIAAYQHQGTIAVNEGSFSVEDDQVTIGTIMMDMTTIVALDKNFNPDAGHTREALVGDLMSPDFFDVENYPSATFIIDAAGSGDVAGRLTIKGVTKKVKIADLSVNELEGVVAVGGGFTFNRQDFGVTYKHTMSDLVVADDVVMTFRIIGS